LVEARARSQADCLRLSEPPPDLGFEDPPIPPPAAVPVIAVWR